MKKITFILCAFLITSITAANLAQAADETEAQLLAVLRSTAPPAEKAITCKKLAIHGSEASVPELEKLLPDAQLSSWARIALEAIPGKAADEALQRAAASVDGRQLIGVINSIGVRRDAGAVELLIGKLKSPQEAVAAAAAAALGRIGNPDATRALRDALADAPAKVRSVVAEGCVLCAERLLSDGKVDAAIAIYDQVRQAEVPMQRIVEATRGAILARKQDGIPLLMEAFRSDNKILFQLALGTVREFPGGEVDQALAKELATASPGRAAMIVYAMADRPQTVVLSAVLNAAEKGPRNVQLAAIDALQSIGDASCLKPLLKIAGSRDQQLADEAKMTLAKLPGEKVDAQIAAMLSDPAAKPSPLLLELVGQRRIDAVPALIRALQTSQPTVRQAALTALGETVPLPQLSVLISQAVSPKYTEDQATAMTALKTASVRIPDRAACATALAEALDDTSVANQSALLEILSEVGGPKALATLAAAAKSNETLLQDTSSRLLGKWNGTEAAPVLLDLARTAPAEKFQVRALRGYIGLARKFAMPDKQRAEMCSKAMQVAQRPAERKLVLEVLKLHPSAEALKLAVDAMKDAELKADAMPVALAIAQKVSGKGVDASKLLAGVGLEPVELEIVKAVYGAGNNQKDVTAAIRKQAGKLPLITLPNPLYNKTFGGDPAPGVVKKLHIQYRINGKMLQASFAENELILLPLSK